jgi:hypothetical protein
MGNLVGNNTGGVSPSSGEVGHEARGSSSGHVNEVGWSQTQASIRVDSRRALEPRDALENNDGGDGIVVIEVRLEPMVMLGVLEALEIVCDPMGRSFSDGEARHTVAMLGVLRAALEPQRATIQRAKDEQLEALF